MPAGVNPTERSDVLMNGLLPAVVVEPDGETPRGIRHNIQHESSETQAK
jgi:hypothetical protein